MPRRKVTFDVEVNTPSAQREADRVAKIFQSRLGNVKVGTSAGGSGRGGGGGGGRGGKSNWLSGMPGSSVGNLLFGSASYALAGGFYQFFSNLPRNIAEMDKLATVNKRAEASFRAMAGGAEEANAMVEAYRQGSGNIATRTEAMTESMRLFGIGLTTNAKEMRTFTTLARGMSQATGRDNSYIEQQFSLGLANQSLLRFDQLGLSVERHKEIVRDLSQQYPELSKEIIFQNAMLQQAVEKYYNLATAQEALATSTEIVTRSLADQRAVLSEWVSANIMQPIAGEAARALGIPDLNLRSQFFRNYAQTEGRGGIFGNMGGGGYEKGSNAAGMMTWAWQQMVNGYQGIAAGPEQHKTNARTAEALVKAMNAGQASRNLGVEPPREYIEFIQEVSDAMAGGAPAADDWAMRLNAMALIMADTANQTDPLADGLMRLGDSAAIAQQQVEDLTGQLTGVAGGMVAKLIKAGMDPNQAIEMVPSEDEIAARADRMVKAGAYKGGDISDAAATAYVEEQITSAGDAWIEAAQESEAAGKRAAAELERAAKESRKAFLDAADKIVDKYDQMLHQIPGLFGTSEVTEEDLKLAKAGMPVNYPDDYLRRFEDVVYNKKKQPGVNIEDVAGALRMPADTDPNALAVYFRRAWQSGELWANPENIEKFLNVGAVKGDLISQEQAALGQQNLSAFFGLGTDQGNEFLKVFGVQALDPIQDGLISEITTRGPIMGETLANAIHSGFEAQSLKLPWVNTIMSAINDQMARELLEGLNNDSASDQAAAEAVGSELP